MLPRKHRLRSSADISLIFRKGKTFFFNGIGCKAFFGHGAGKRIGFAQSKRIFPRAVDRNRAKRLLSEAVSSYITDIPDGTDLLFFFQKKDVSLGQKEIFVAVSGIIRGIAYFLKKKKA